MKTELQFNVDANVLKKNRTEYHAGTLQGWLTSLEKSLQEKVNKDPTIKQYCTEFPEQYFIFENDIKNLLKNKGFNVKVGNSYEDGATILLMW
jgi:hypothetical protein